MCLAVFTAITCTYRGGRNRVKVGRVGLGRVSRKHHLLGEACPQVLIKLDGN
jgi:hypothetical protein